MGEVARCGSPRSYVFIFHLTTLGIRGGVLAEILHLHNIAIFSLSLANWIVECVRFVYLRFNIFFE